MPTVGPRVVHIGHCVGCGDFGRLAGFRNDACTGCLTGLGRGPGWLQIARRVRAEPLFARQVYEKIPDAWRDNFHQLFGRPPGT
ncbi:MAG: hypothetical protein ACLQVI_25745 [Polyangiaceae bacterium]